MDAARAQPALGNLETAPLAQQHIVSRHAHVLERHLACHVGRAHVAEHRQRAQQFHARDIPRHDDHRLLLVFVRVARVGFSHEDEQRAARVGRAGGKPLASVYDIVIAVANDGRLDVGGIRRCNRRLGHGEAGARPALQQRRQPLLLLFRGAVAHQHFHVAGVRRRAVEYLGRPHHPPHDFA